MRLTKDICTRLASALLLAAGAGMAHAVEPATQVEAARSASLPRAPGAEESGRKPEDLETQRPLANFKREGLPFAVLAESRNFRVAAGISPRKVAGIYFVRKAGDQH
jgi:hypothetical protein